MCGYVRAFAFTKLQFRTALRLPFDVLHLLDRQARETARWTYTFTVWVAYLYANVLKFIGYGI